MIIQEIYDYNFYFSPENTNSKPNPINKEEILRKEIHGDGENRSYKGELKTIIAMKLTTIVMILKVNKLKIENKGKNQIAGCYGSFGLAQTRGLRYLNESDAGSAIA